MEQKVNNDIKSHKDELLETLNDDRIKFVGDVIGLIKLAHEEFLKEFRKELLPDVTYG